MTHKSNESPYAGAMQAVGVHLQSNANMALRCPLHELLGTAGSLQLASKLLVRDKRTQAFLLLRLLWEKAQLPRCITAVLL